MKTKIYKISLLLSLFAFIISCDSDDFTGDSTLTATNPSLSVTLGFNNSESLVETDAVYPFTVTLSETQIVNVSVNLSFVSGTATPGEDFDFPAHVVIKAGQTSASGEITIMADELIEDTENAVIMITTGKEANVSGSSSQTVEFQILNLEGGDLVVDLAWETASKTTDSSGNEISPTDFADLRLLISSTPDNAGDIGQADGSGFEKFIISSDTPDGMYYIVADFYAANEDVVRNLNLSLTLNQTGIINNMNTTYGGAISNLGTCSLNYYVMTKVIKSGDSYTFEDISTQSYELLDYSPVLSGVDATDVFVGDHVSEVVVKQICDGLFIQGLNASWMLNSWGEEIQPGAGEVFASLASDGTLTIKSQYIFTTSYDGSLYDYTVSGTGMFDSATGTVNISYSLDQDGFSPDQWMFDNNYMATSDFIATLTSR